jgi:hypothetical protein
MYIYLYLMNNIKCIYKIGYILFENLKELYWQFDFIILLLLNFGFFLSQFYLQC